LDVRVTGTGNVANFQSDSGPNIRFTGTETSGRTYQLGEGLVTAGSFSVYDTTGSAERLVINSSGNLGLGVTPSAWNSGYKAIQIKDEAFISGVSSLYSSANAYLDSAGTYRYTYAFAFASLYEQTNGVHTWKTTSSTQGLGNSISFTSAMTLTRAGDLLVGTTSSTYSASGRGVIEVNGSSTSLIALERAAVPSAYFLASAGEFQLNNTEATPMTFYVNGSERARIDSSGNLLVAATAVGNGGKLYVNGSISLGTSTTGAQSSMAKDTTQLTSSVSTSATTIFTDIASGMSSAAAGYFIIYGSNNAGAGFMDVVIAKSSGTPVVVSSSTIEGSPPARTYSVSSAALRLTMASGTFNVNLKATIIGYPF
jgi:hypothetical protein